MQLNRYLAQCGVSSRRGADRLIRSGHVRLNGHPILNPAVRIDPEYDLIQVDGRLVRPETKRRYILLNKPRGILTAVSDDRGRRTVCDLVSVPERVFPVGRLDHDTAGVLLLTNDGALAYRLSHPRFEIVKIYHAEVEGRVRPETVARFAQGIDIGEGRVVRAEARVIKAKADSTLLEIRVHEGRKRQIRRMCRAVGHPVLSLERTVFAGLTAEGLSPGAWRELEAAEVARLYRLCGLGQEVSRRRESGKSHPPSTQTRKKEPLHP